MGVEVVVGDDACLGVFVFEAGEEGAKGGYLGWGAGVFGGLAIGGEAADVTDAEGDGVKA